MNLNYKNRLDKALSEGDDGLAMEILEEAEIHGGLERMDRILMGILAMFPPNTDPYLALEVLERAYNKNPGLHEAVWLCYTHTWMWLGEDCFSRTLMEFSEDETALHILADLLICQDQYDRAILANEKSTAIKPLPRSILFKLTHNPPGSSEAVKQLARDLEASMEIISSELDPGPTSAAEQYLFFWDELILGTRKTESNWKSAQETVAIALKRCQWGPCELFSGGPFGQSD